VGLEILVNGFLQIGRAYGAEKFPPMKGGYLPSDVVIIPSAFGIATAACRGLPALPMLVHGR